VVLLSLLLLHDPARRGPDGAEGALSHCMLVAEAGGAALCGPRGLFHTLRRCRVSARPHGGLTPIVPELAWLMARPAWTNSTAPYDRPV
jgi:hypothetical protein